VATYTRADLRDQVLHDLGVLDAGEAAEAEDAEFVERRIQQVLEGLDHDGLIPFNLDGDEIPARYMVPLTQVIAPTLANAFGLGQRLADFAAIADAGMRQLRRLKAQPYYGAPTKATYY
jgi:hypothetical protein